MTIAPISALSKITRKSFTLAAVTASCANTRMKCAFWWSYANRPRKRPTTAAITMMIAGVIMSVPIPTVTVATDEGAPTMILVASTNMIAINVTIAEAARTTTTFTRTTTIVKVINTTMMKVINVTITETMFIKTITTFLITATAASPRLTRIIELWMTTTATMATWIVIKATTRQANVAKAVTATSAMI